MQRNRVTDFFFPFCPGLQESPEGWMTTQVEQAWAEAPSCTAESSKSGLDPVFSGQRTEQSSQWSYQITTAWKDFLVDEIQKEFEQFMSGR